MTENQIKRARRKIAKPGYYRKRLRLMRRTAGYWEEVSILDGNEERRNHYAKIRLRYAKRELYYERKLKEKYGTEKP